MFVKYQIPAHAFIDTRTFIDHTSTLIHKYQHVRKYQHVHKDTLYRSAIQCIGGAHSSRGHEANSCFSYVCVAITKNWTSEKKHINNITRAYHSQNLICQIVQLIITFILCALCFEGKSRIMTLLIFSLGFQPLCEGAGWNSRLIEEKMEYTVHVEGLLSLRDDQWDLIGTTDPLNFLTKFNECGCCQALPV